MSACAWTKAVTLGLLLVAVLLQTEVASAGGTTTSCVGPGNPCGLTIEKLVNGNIADTAPGVLVPVGSILTFTYVVTATAPAQNPAVHDDNGTPGFTADDFSPVLVSGDTTPNGILDPGETWTFSSPGHTALLGLHTNIGEVGLLFFCSPTSCNGGIVSDPASYTGVVPAPASLVLVAIALSGLALLTQVRSRPRTL